MKKRALATMMLAGAFAALGGEPAARAEPPAPRPCGLSNPWGEPKECPSAKAPPVPTAPRRTAEPLDLTSRGAPPPERFHSPKLAFGGAILGSVGLASLVMGVAVVVARDPPPATLDAAIGDAVGSAVRPLLGGGLIVHGVICLGAGIPMMVVGLRRMASDRGPPAVVVPAISAGPRSMALRWSF